MQYEMTLDAHSGELRVSGLEQVLYGGIERELLAQQWAGLVYGEWDVKNGYYWLKFHQLHFAGMPCGMSVCFFNGRAEMVHFGVALKDQELVSDWPTRESSERQIEFVRRELQRMLGQKLIDGQAEFNWGVVWSRFDEKAFCAISGVMWTEK